MPISSTAETVVNTVTANDQTAPAMVTFDNGLYMAAWAEVGSGSIIYQLFNADGSANGGEVVISAVGAANLSFTKLSSGGVVLGFTGTNGGNGTDVLAVMFDSSGLALSPGVVVTNTVGTQTTPSFTTLADGSIVAVWQDAFNGDQVEMRLYNADMSAASAAVIVSTAANAVAGGTSVAALESGSFVVTYVNSISGSNEIRSKIYSADGTLEVAEFTVNVGTANNQMAPQVKALAGGNFMVTWSTDNGTTLNGRIFNDAGVATGAADIVINSTAMAVISGGTDSQVTQLADGSILVVWKSYEGTSNEIRARLFDANGTAINNDFLVNTTTGGSQEQPTVTAHADGTFTIAWQGYNGADMDIYSRTYNPAKFFGVSGAETYNGLNVADVIYGYGGIDTLNGRGGNDKIYGGTENDTIDGGDGNDVLYGEEGSDTVRGGLGNDALYAGAAGVTGRNNLEGGDGDDVMYAGSGIDKFDGGAGTDTVSYYYGGAVSVDLTAANAVIVGGAAAGDLFALTSPENLDGSATGGDTLVGNAGANRLRGFGGNDALTGAVGADVLFGGTGNDTLDGGADNDTIWGEAGNDTILAGAGNDVIIAGSGSDTINGDVGIDTLSYLYETVGIGLSLNGGVGTGGASGDTTTAGSIENVYGSNVGNDTITGNTLANVLRGYAGNDTLNGYHGADTLDGGLGDDTLNGGNDNDQLTGGGGNDIFNGGAGLDTYTANAAGADAFVFSASSEVSLGVETINTFNGNQDSFDFNDTGFAGTVVGAVTAAMWQARTDNVAQRATDRFIYETDVKTLWYDADGTGATAAVAVVKFGLIAGTFDYNDLEIV